jgi:hypothetical protein
MQATKPQEKPRLRKNREGEREQIKCERETK